MAYNHWLENREKAHSIISEKTYKKILPHISSIIAQYHQLELQFLGYSTTESSTSIHADFKDISGNLAALRNDLRSIISRVAPELKFKTACPHALVAKSFKPIDPSSILAMSQNQTFQIANINMMYDEHTNKNIVTHRFKMTQMDDQLMLKQA